jgi:hypothetical protein
MSLNLTLKKSNNSNLKKLGKFGKWNSFKIVDIQLKWKWNTKIQTDKFAFQFIYFWHFWFNQNCLHLDSLVPAFIYKKVRLSSSGFFYWTFFQTQKLNRLSVTVVETGLFMLNFLVFCHFFKFNSNFFLSSCYWNFENIKSGWDFFFLLCIFFSLLCILENFSNQWRKNRRWDSDKGGRDSGEK